MNERIAYQLDEAALALGMSRRQLYRLLDANELESFHEGRRRMVSRRALEAYVAKREEQARAERAKAA